MRQPFSSHCLRPALLLVSALALFVAVWAVYPKGLNRYDAFEYARRAYMATQGHFFGEGTGHPFDQRIGVYLPVSLFYRILGVSVTTTILWPLCASLMIIATVWAAATTRSARLYVLLLSVASVPLFNASSDLLPDVIAVAFMAQSVLTLNYRVWASCGSWRRCLIPMWGAASLLIAFSAKEWAYWALPLWMALLGWDAANDKRALLRRFYLPAACTGIVLGACYLLLVRMATGDWLTRFRGLQELTGNHIWSWDRASHTQLVRRLTVAPAIFFLKQYGIVAVLAFLDVLAYPRKNVLWKCYTVMMVLWFWFGTTSFSRYEPLPLELRQSLAVLPGFLILASHFVSRLVVIPDKNSPLGRKWPVLLLLAALVLPPALGFHLGTRKWQFQEVSGAMRTVQAIVEKSLSQRYLLLTSDARSPCILPFFFSYNCPTNMAIHWGQGVSEDLLDEHEEVILYIDQSVSQAWAAAYGIRNYDEDFSGLGLNKFYELNGVQLFKGHLDERLRHSLLALAKQPPQ